MKLMFINMSYLCPVIKILVISAVIPVCISEKSNLLCGRGTIPGSEKTALR